MTTDPPTGDEPLEVLRGKPTGTELAAVAMAVVTRDLAVDDPLRRWRAARRAALRAQPEWSSHD